MTAVPRLGPVVRALVFVRGRVQGVGFRWWTRARALELGLVGHPNLPRPIRGLDPRGRDGVRAALTVLRDRGVVD